MVVVLGHLDCAEEGTELCLWSSTKWLLASMGPAPPYTDPSFVFQKLHM